MGQIQPVCKLSVAFGIQMVTCEHEEGAGPGMGLGYRYTGGVQPLWAGLGKPTVEQGRGGMEAGLGIASLTGIQTDLGGEF